MKRLFTALLIFAFLGITQAAGPPTGMYGGAGQPLSVSDSPTFAGGTVTGNFIVGSGGLGTEKAEIAADEAYLSLVGTRASGLTESAIIAYMKDAGGTYQKLGVNAFQWATNAVDGGYGVWDVHTSSLAAGVATDHYGFATWALHGAGIFPNGTTSASAPGRGVLGIWNSGTVAPTASITDAVKLWVTDNGSQAGKATLFMRDEAGNSGPVIFNTPQQNILPNTQWLAMSGSTLENVRALPDATSTVVGTTVSSDAHLLTAGMLVKDAAGTPLVFEVVTVAANSFTVDRAGGTDGQWYEVTPGYTAADVLAPDGWQKSGTNINVFREHNGTNTKDGAFYALKTVTAAASQDVIYFDSSYYTNYAKLKGKTVTIGAWVKTDTASHAYLAIQEMGAGAGTSASAYHSGGNTYEWLEVSRTLGTGVTEFYLYLRNALSTKTAYFSQPIAIIGPAIGSGNYAPKPGEQIFLDANITLTNYTATTSAADGIINLEAQSRGMIGKGVKAVLVKAYGKDSAAADGIGFTVKSATGSEAAADGISIDTQVNNIRVQGQGWVKTDTNGDIYFDHRGSGASALTVDVKVIGIMP